jgi:hypothetical protein
VGEVSHIDTSPTHSLNFNERRLLNCVKHNIGRKSCWELRWSRTWAVMVYPNKIVSHFVHWLKNSACLWSR